MYFITIYDYLLLPVYLFAFYFLIVTKAKKYENGPLRKYFIVAFFLHMLGSFLYCMVIQYYYGYGDSFGFYQGSDFIRNVISNTGDPVSPFFMSSDDFERVYGAASAGDLSLPTGIDVDSNLTVMKISAALSYVSFNSYLIISLFFGLFAFTGLWKLYKTMTAILGTGSARLLAIFILYLPSVCFWGSGLIKDSICLGAIGFIIYYLYKVLIQKKFKWRDPFLLLILFYLLFIIKSYVAIVLLASIVLAYVINIIINSKKNILKLMVVAFVLLITATILVASLSSTVDSIIEDSKNNIETFKGAYAAEDENSIAGFGTADTDISLGGILLRSPLAVFTTLFRPFLWESGKMVMFLSALESLLTLALTIFVLVKCRIWRFFYYIFNDPYVFFCFIFTVLMGVIVGLSTFNFGTLVRYRLPVLPFYFFMLLGIYLKNKEARLLKK